MIGTLGGLKDRLQELEPKKIAVAGAADQDIMDVILYCLAYNHFKFVLIDDKNKLSTLLQKNNIDESKHEIVDIADHKKAAEAAVALAKQGKCDAIMKGNLHTAEIFKAVLNKETGISSGKILSEITICNKPNGSGLLLMTDCAISISPTTEEKIAILENAVQLAHKLGFEKPKVALLSALELVNPKIPFTQEAAIICKMAERGQIKGCIVDGPLALDNILCSHSAAQKGIKSLVAGYADIIVAPDLQVANVLHKSVVFFGKQDVACAIVGANVPIIATSRSDSPETKQLSVALALLTA